MIDMVTLTKYESYKDSGIEWIGEIPSHWEIISLKYLSYLESGETIKPEQFTDEGYPVYGGNGFRGYTNRFTNDGHYPLIGRQGALCGNVNYAKGPFYASEHAIVVYPFDDIETLWLGEVIRLADFNRLSQSTAQPGIAVSVIKHQKLPVPPMKERNEIAKFLKDKYIQIDSAITSKQQQIVLLKEHKQIIIEQAVTQGVNSNAPVKDSGIDWIGEIPEHWQVKRAKYLFNEIDERSENGDEELLSVSHLTGVTPRSEKSVTMIAEDYSGSKTCQKNDFVMNIMWAWMGAMGVSDRPGIVSSAYSIFRQTPLDTFNPVYLEWLMKTVGYIEHYNKVSTGLHSSRLRFYSRMFFDMEIGYPNRNEQDEIVTHIEKQSFKIDEAVELQKQQIEKLKEYKTTLINSVVTGKIKVI